MRIYKENKNLLEKRKLEFCQTRGENYIFYNSISKIKDFSNINFKVIIITVQIGGKYRKLGNIEFVPLYNLMINPLKKQMGIEYRVCDINSKDHMQNNDNMMYDPPIMAFDDPVRIWYGWNPGCLVEIVRTDKNKYYRKISQP